MKQYNWINWILENLNKVMIGILIVLCFFIVFELGLSEKQETNVVVLESWVETSDAIITVGSSYRVLILTESCDSYLLKCSAEEFMMLKNKDDVKMKLRVGKFSNILFSFELCE